MADNISGIALIQWMQILDALAWGLPMVIFMPAVAHVWRGKASPIDVLMTPVVFIAINRIWACAAWLIYPQLKFVPNEWFLWFAVHVFSILAAAGVLISHRRAAALLR